MKFGARRYLAVAVLVHCAFAAGATPPKSSVNLGTLQQSIDAGLRCHRDLNYGCAITRLSAARAAADEHAITIPEKERCLLLRTLAFALASVEKHAEATQVFWDLLRVRPSERLDPAIVSPKIMRDFTAARIKFFEELIPIPIAPLPVLKPFVSSGPGSRDLVLHVPDELRLASRVRTDEEIVHTIGFEAGAGLLFGDDTENFSTGFSVGLTYSYDVSAPLQLGLRLGFAQHSTSRTDVKAGYPSQLLAFHGGPELRVAFDLGDYVELALGVSPGIHASGVGTLGEKVGGVILGSLTVMARPVPEIGVGIAVLPGVVLATTADGLGSSFTLPVTLRLEGAF